MQPLAQTFCESRPLSQVSRYLPYALIALFAVITAAARLYVFPDSTWEWHLVSFLLAVGVAYLFWTGFDAYVRFMDHWMPYSRSIARRIAAQIVISLAMMLVFRTTALYLFGYLIPVPFNRVLNLVILGADVLFILTLNVGYIGAHFFQLWKESLLKAERLQREAATVRFDNLRNQLNPHFLFNSLTSLNSLIHEDQALASRFLQQLSRVYRYVLQHKSEQMVSLAVELDFVRNYVFLLHTRFDGALTVTEAVPEAHRHLQIVPVTMQILIENALKHNSLSEACPLRIVIETDPNGEYLTVRNNLQPKHNVETSNRTGLDNMRALYSFYTPQPVLVEQAEREFRVRIPLIPT